MKSPFYFLAFLTSTVFCFLACSQSPKDTATSTTPVTADSVASADVIHGFYQWYNGFLNEEAKDMNFLNEDGTTLNQTALESYFSFFKATGFVSNQFVEGEYAFYKKCEELWKKEASNPGEVLPCLDADKYFCAQDWELDYWVKSPVRIKLSGQDKMTATLYGTHGGSPMERNFELVKENGKWLLSKIECDMGIN
jgi:hypothetical protein